MLEDQYLGGEVSVYFDIDNKAWVRCDECNKPHHVDCLNALVVNLQESCFYCCR